MIAHDEAESETPDLGRPRHDLSEQPDTGLLYQTESSFGGLALGQQRVVSRSERSSLRDFLASNRYLATNDTGPP
jgi:hypothetical protein